MRRTAAENDLGKSFFHFCEGCVVRIQTRILILKRKKNFFGLKMYIIWREKNLTLRSGRFFSYYPKRTAFIKTLAFSAPGWQFLNDNINDSTSASVLNIFYSRFFFSIRRKCLNINTVAVTDEINPVPYTHNCINYYLARREYM